MLLRVESKKDLIMRKWGLALLVLPSISVASDISFENVHINKEHVNFVAGELFFVQFDLSASASVTLKIYDGRDWLIKQITSENPLPKGENKIVWDGTDQAQNIVPDEAYTYTLEARDKNGQVVSYDPADNTGGEDLVAKNVRWDAASKKIHYFLNHSGRVSVRVGLQNNGPLLRTVVDWVPRTAGVHEEAWDGKDASGVLDLTQH